ncbi:hypothetical protein EB820_15815 [Brevibacillus agri]|uniref:Uncharacterized protein n=1 Tax=Brevibacillus agri TaxID=51101 RepID=A0A3M8AQU6_9BACL|nr:hypothetical protein D478_10130 [Brevibacillus agri BAB-2500]MBG9567508.1 hypothetical protein [Brevibacillus agri]QAV12109.1 hypothetical protein BA6348_04635 [Brevibacillus agri]RNB53566.1 hypothetical protein EB820_15815 [Brevibacillus agri]
MYPFFVGTKPSLLPDFSDFPATLVSSDQAQAEKSIVSPAVCAFCCGKTREEPCIEMFGPKRAAALSSFGKKRGHGTC